MGTPIQAPMTLPRAADMAQQSRLSVARSSAFALLGNNAEVEEIREAITPSLRTDLTHAVSGVREASKTVFDMEDDAAEYLMAEIGRFVALAGGGWLPEQRQEFIVQAASTLGEIPAGLLEPAIHEARKRVWDAKRFVSWIFEFVEADLRKLETERARLERLAEIAG